MTPPPINLIYSRKQKTKNIAAHTYLRGVRIPSSVLSKRVAVFNGKYFSSFIVKRMMIGRKFGEFSVTKKLGRTIHIKKEKKKKGRKK